MTYVAVNIADRVYLRKSKRIWYSTTDGTTAYHHSARKQIENAIDALATHGVSKSGWMVMSTQEASRVIPRRKSVDTLLYSEENPFSAKQSEQININTSYNLEPIFDPTTDHSNAIIEKIREIHLLTSEEYILNLSKKISQADKLISDIYHQIEYENFNACEGYKLAKKMQVALRARRGIKNEMAIIQHIHQCGISDISRIEEIAAKTWKPERDVLLEGNM